METGLLRLLISGGLAGADEAAARNPALRAAVDQLKERLDRALGLECECAPQPAGRDDTEDWLARRPANLDRDREERVAGNMTPSCAAPAAASAPEPEEIPESLDGMDPLLAALADGRRTVLAIHRLRDCEVGRHSRLRETIRQFRALAQTGYARIAYGKTFRMEDLLQGLRRLSIGSGQTVLVHSSFFSLGPLERGPATFFRAFEQAVGADGTICMPSFAYNTVERHPEPYDVNRTPGHTGLLTNLFLQRPGVVRSRHPSHGVAAWGRHAAYIIKDNVLYSPYDIRGAFGKLYELDARIIMIGAAFYPNSMLHTVEDWAELPSMCPAAYHYLDEAGRRREVVYDRVPFHFRDFYTAELSTFERLFRRRGLIIEGEVGLARAFIMKCRDIVDYGLELLREGSFGFLFREEGATPGVREILRRLKEGWSFPDQILDRLRALRK